MKKNISLLMAIFTFAAMISPCSAQNPSLKGVSHGKEKAYTGDEEAGQLEELHLTILENEVETTDIELKYRHDFYEARYMKDGEKDFKALSPKDVFMLQDALIHIYNNENYYQDYNSKDGQEGLEWHLGTKHKNAAFLINGTRVDYKNFAIMNHVINYFDDIFEYITSDKPFPKGKLVYYHYSNKGSMLPGGPEWTVERMADGKYKVTYLNDSNRYREDWEKPPFKKEIFCDENFGNNLYEILRQGKIQNYKSEYFNPAVLDGSSWSFEVKFDDGQEVRTRGYMDGPRDMSGINKSLNYLRDLMGISY